MVKKLVKFLVLGTGNAQVDILEYLHGLPNIQVYALSNAQSGSGMSFVDVFEVIDITNKQAVLRYVKQNNIDYIYSVGSDVAMPTVMWVAEKLDLKHFVSSKTADLCNTKHELRGFLQNIYGSVPFEELLECLTIQAVSFPAMVKPVDSQGQRGVSTVNDKNELAVAYEYAIQFSRSRKVIIENKIDGPEISVNTFMIDGVLVFFLPSDRLSWEGFDGGVIHKHILPTSLNDKAVKNVHRLVTETLSKLEINNGPAYFQIKMTGDIPYLIEVTPRLDGCHMWRLIHETTGVNLLTASVNLLFGKQVDIIKQHTIKPGALKFICQPPNSDFMKPKLNEDNFKYIAYYYEQGDLVKPMNGKMEKCGYVIKVAGL